ncbi:hypothetical protein SBOR_8227 [Sclerotinia borealis F-4128]|uniref:Uncharacterized protein n=1 Tax=Sclerotinia borealis (strain F-4128) TaxID=1432307 RepID=W9CA11_SCLBF|nr:hypothetical protein SBOR_8227 [Sclerotinia borealis F-4128]
MRPTILPSMWISSKDIVLSHKSLSISTYSLPYVERYRNEDEFNLGGSFADIRNPEALAQSRAPGYCSLDEGFDDENGEYMRSWELCINE